MDGGESIYLSLSLTAVKIVANDQSKLGTRNLRYFPREVLVPTAYTGKNNSATRWIGFNVELHPEKLFYQSQCLDAIR